MDSVPLLKISYRLDELHSAELQERWQLVLNVTGDFRIHVANKLLYQESDFCLLEFAMQVMRWLQRVSSSGKDFFYTSMESEEKGLVWIKKCEDGWRIGSVHQLYKETRPFKLAEINKCLLSYTEALRNELWQHYKINAAALISGEEKFYEND